MLMPLANIRRFFYKALQQPGYACRVFSRRLKIYFYYLFGNGRSAYPEAITLFLTHRCNLSCKMCGQWGREGVTKKQASQYINSEIPLDTMKLIIDNIALFLPNITLFGGEPLLYRGCAEVIRYIKNKGMHCLMITNGSLIEDSVKDIVDSGLDELNVSIDGNASLHDGIRGLPGLFEKIIKGLKEVQRFKVEMKKKKPLINLQCTITKYNYKHLEQLLDVAGEAGADSLTFHNLIFLDHDALERQKVFDEMLGCGSADWEGFKFEPGIDPEALYDKIKKILALKYRFAVDFYPNFSRNALIQYYKNSERASLEYSERCVSPWMAAYIFPDGEVRPCLNSSYSYGNALSDKFTELWNGDKAVRFRRFLKQKRVFPVCARCTELYRY